MMHCPVLKDVMPWLLALKNDLWRQKNLYYLLLLAGNVVLAAGFLVFMIDPNIHSLGDGLWYAWSSMTLTGYGDVVPASFLGRILGIVLIAFGIISLALINATLSAMLIGRDMTQVEKEESVILQEIKRLHERLDQLEGRK